MSDGTTTQQQAMTTLMEMGFDEPRSREALAACNDNVERAIEYLFAAAAGDPPTTTSGSVSAETAATSSSSSYQDIVAPISQYHFDQGRSACTCIALTAARQFLQQPSVPAVTPEFLQDAITQGVTMYQQLQVLSSSSSSSSVEHMSAEEVLSLAGSNSGGGGGGGGLGASLSLSNLQLTAGGIRQGILSKIPNAELGLHAMLTACRQDAPSDKWLAVLITKTPETVLACLPPPNDTSSNSNGSYMILDSHSRPGVVQSNDGAYARIGSSLKDIVRHLETILPATELGPDIGEMMAMMYNSFDLYPLILKS